MTLQAVADEAGVSKGGLLYHFSSKSELVRGLVERLVDDTNGNYAQWDDGEPGSYTRAYIASTCHNLTTEDADGCSAGGRSFWRPVPNRKCRGRSLSVRGVDVAGAGGGPYPVRAQIAGSRPTDCGGMPCSSTPFAIRSLTSE